MDSWTGTLAHVKGKLGDVFSSADTSSRAFAPVKHMGDVNHPTWPLDNTHSHVIFTSVTYLNLPSLRGKLSLPARLGVGDS